VRQFAVAALADTPGHDAVRRRHAEHYLRVAERLGPEVRVKGQGRALRQMERDLGNLRSALDYWVRYGDAESALRLASALEPFWSATNHFREGVDALDAALSLQAPATERDRGRASLARSLLLRRLNASASQEDARDALVLARACGDLEGQCMALDALAYQTAWAGDFDGGAQLAWAEQAVAEQLGDPYHLGMALVRQAMVDPRRTLPEVRALAEQAEPLLRHCQSLHRVADLMSHVVMSAFDNRDYVAASELAAEAVLVAQQADDVFNLQVSLGNAGLAALFLEDMEAAERHFRRQLAICREEHLEGRWAEPVLGLAIVAAHAGDHERAATLAGAAEPAVEDHVAEADRAIFERLIARFLTPARTAVGEPAWERARAAGAALTREHMYDLALQHERLAASPTAPSPSG
jgi:hypothetical protein